jgi:general secretion pathway protein F
MIYVLPKIVGVFIQTKQQLPLLTQILLGISTWLTHWWWTLIPVGMLFAWGWRQMREVSHLRQKRDTWLLKKMLIGPLIKNFNTTQFAGTLSTLLSSGVPLLQSLESAAQTMPNHAMRQAVRQAIVKVREGGALSKALSESKKFPPVLIQMISNGEKTGKLTQMLTKAASIERLQLERKLVLASSLLEPIMIVIMGGVVLLIVLAVLMPIININQMVK